MKKLTAYSFVLLCIVWSSSNVAETLLTNGQTHYVTYDDPNYTSGSMITHNYRFPLDGQADSLYIKVPTDVDVEVIPGCGIYIGACPHFPLQTLYGGTGECTLPLPWVDTFTQQAVSEVCFKVYSYGAYDITATLSGSEQCTESLLSARSQVAGGCDPDIGVDRNSISFYGTQGTINENPIPDDGSVIDVMVLYTSSAEAAFSNIESKILQAVEEANTAYINSNVTQRLRLVHAQKVADTPIKSLPFSMDYDTRSAYIKFIDEFTSVNEHNLGLLAENPDITELRNAYKADLVSLWIKNDSNCNDDKVERGRAHQLWKNSLSYERYAFSLLLAHCANAPHYTFTHELGHNMGAHHDKYSVNKENKGSPLYTYSHAHILPYSNITTSNGSEDVSWRTMMGILDACPDCPRKQYFSNPEVMYKGVISMGSADANNAKTLNNTAGTVSRFRESLKPGISKESQSFEIRNNGSSDLNISSIDVDGGNVNWLLISQPNTDITIPPNGTHQVNIQVDYLQSPMVITNKNILVFSNDPDESPYEINVTVNYQEGILPAENDARDILFNSGTGNLLMTVALASPSQTTTRAARAATQNVFNASLSLIDPVSLIFELNTVDAAPIAPSGDFPVYNPDTGIVHIPVVNVADENGTPHPFEVEMTMLPASPEGKLQFQVTAVTPIGIEIVE